MGNYLLKVRLIFNEFSRVSVLLDTRLMFSSLNLYVYMFTKYTINVFRKISDSKCLIYVRVTGDL